MRSRERSRLPCIGGRVSGRGQGEIRADLERSDKDHTRLAARRRREGLKRWSLSPRS